MTRSSWQRSPWDADPLSWFTTPNLPLAAATIALVQGALTLIVTDQSGSRPAVQVLALAISVLSLLTIHFATRPHRGTVTLSRAIALSLLSSFAMVVSAVGYAGETFSLHLWWAPLATSLAMLALAPYTTAFRLLVAGMCALAVAGVSTLAFVVPDDPRWPPYSAVTIALFPVIVGVVGGVVMIHAINERLARWNERPLTAVANDNDRTLVALVDATTSKRIAAGRGVIQAVLERGEVTAADARRAADLAERLRRELTHDVDRTWLERVAVGSRLKVDDEHRLADELDLAQRTALRALIDAVLTGSQSTYGSASVELRRTVEGAIAVALHLASSWPEGKRDTFLAPYYVTLQSAVNKLRWRSGPVTAIEFEVSGRSRATNAALHNTPEPGTPGGPRR